MHMRHKLDSDTRLIKGLVLDHGSRHPEHAKTTGECLHLELQFLP